FQFGYQCGVVDLVHGVPEDHLTRSRFAHRGRQPCRLRQATDLRLAHADRVSDLQLTVPFQQRIAHRPEIADPGELCPCADGLEFAVGIRAEGDGHDDVLPCDLYRMKSHYTKMYSPAGADRAR